MSQSTEKLFDVNDYLNQNSVRNVKNHKEEEKSTFENKITFEKLWRQVKSHFEAVYDSSSMSAEEKVKRNELEELATLGRERESRIIIDEINEYLRTKNLLGAEYPISCYDSLAEAVFHEIYRFGIFAKWNKHPDSVSAKIKGQKLLFKEKGYFNEQKERLREGQVEEIIRTLQMRIKGLKINESNPSEEFDMDDGTRIKVMIPPRTPVPTITFRRFIVKNFSFMNQAKMNTIPYEDVELYEILSKSLLNTIVAGHVESGKSTLLKTMYGARDKRLSCILIEDTPETYLWRDFPDRDSTEIYLNGKKNIHEAIRDALRIDHHFIMFQEVRGIEADGAIGATERGTRGLIMTYHITDPKNTPRQLAQHIVDEFPQRDQLREIKRIADSLDIGITMETIKDGTKRVTSVYEICFDSETNEAWINYLIKWDKTSDKWKYNNDVSSRLLERISFINEDLATRFIEMMNERANVSPLQEKATYSCL